MENPIDIFKQLIQFIEDNIYEVITLESLEKKSGLSRFQLTRLFLKLSGYSPIDYVRRRKLSKSIPELYNRRRVLDIAIDYGFEYEQSYIRAFRTVYQFSPTQLRKQKLAVTLFEPPKLNNIRIYTDGFLTSPEIKYLSDITFYGEEKYYNYKDNNVYGMPLLDGLAKHSNGIFTGICIPCGSGSFTHRYISCHNDTEQNSTIYNLPKGKYVVFNYTGFHSLDKNSAHKLRTLMYIVINSWASRNKFRWQENFIEQVNLDLLSESYIEVDIIVPLS
jgi:AraC family transcriptional regulator